MAGTFHLRSDAAGIAEAARLIRAGNLVAFPTETVYGLGGDATDEAAVAGIYAAKSRPGFNPLIVHLPDKALVCDYAQLGDKAGCLAEAFWPGALTLVLPLCPDSGLSERVTAGLATVAVRVPDHPVAQALIKAAGCPVAAPSANPSGRVSPTTAKHVLDGLGGQIAAVVDGGACTVGLESTIIGFADGPVLLRAGGVPTEAIEARLGGTPLRVGADAKITAPGQLTSHYAPKAEVRPNAEDRRPGERLLGFGPVKADLNLSPAGDLVEAAANLFACLRQLDGAGTIAVSPIPQHGLGRAINDRLARAAAPRPAPRK